MLKEFNYKKFGYVKLHSTEEPHHSFSSFLEHIRIMFLPANFRLKVDFREFLLPNDALLFVNPKVVVQPIGDVISGGELVYFNRDFYCIELHDQEVACDGILYNNVFEVPFIELSETQSSAIQHILNEIKIEMANEDSQTEEMLRILLKLVILKSTRIWKEKHQLSENDKQTEVQFLRKFSKLVEIHYKTHHSVADYADMLFITPKSLSKKISLLSKETPNDIIKNRIILESKRLLAHTSMAVKEIAYSLNYEDDAYFVRFFTKNTGISPTAFRKQF
ncbi:MAG: helix-turn-helix domain-containing protein [Pedobacter sp.]|uniref:helix-turn-helix domain-containing protein n=1 Tax=Pedobacter sp. TaxID=1411316 RepID=UPI002806BF14|nr:helix-turn-helix domain-containing protein [Pedobacter sp.]MDQ8006478.1 helix-turn-helix domain-containing protein [Pedobacter sp.]